MQLACAFDVTDCRFTGKERDSESGLDKLRSALQREYDGPLHES